MSVRTIVLFGIALFVAVAAVAGWFPLTIWPTIHFYLWVAIVVACGIEVVTLPRVRGAFALGMLVGTLCYAAAASFEDDVGQRLVDAPPHLTMPHRPLLEYLVPLTDLPYDEDYNGPTWGTFDEFERRASLYRWTVANCSLAFGLATGCLTLAVNRRRRRAAKGAS